jgi:hypothetical protein
MAAATDLPPQFQFAVIVVFSLASASVLGKNMPVILLFKESRAQFTLPHFSQGRTETL